MISVDYRHVCVAWMKQLRSGIRNVLPVVSWPSRASPQAAPAPQETTQLSAAPARPALAPTVTEDTLAQAVAHLEYLGYAIELQPDGWSYARHPYRYDFHLRMFAHGINLHCQVGIGATIDNSRARWLDYLNTANERSDLTRFSLTADHDDPCQVRMRARVFGAYNRSVFAMVMDMWHQDLDLVRRRPAFPLETTVDECDDVAAVTMH